MNKKARIIFSLLLILTPALTAWAQDADLKLRPVFKPGQEDRYIITASVETVVTPEGANGLAGSARRELTATVLLRTLDVNDKGEVTQEAVIEKIEARGAQPIDTGTLAGSKVELQLSGANGLLKVSMPEQVADLGLADLLFSLRGWFPAGDVAVGQQWQATGQGLVYSERMSEIGKAATTTYKLVSLQGNTATIEGAIALNQSGPAVVSATAGKTNVNVIGKGAGKTRFEYDAAQNRIIGGETETRFEGRLANIAPAAEGEKLQPRIGSVVETSKYSIKLVP